MRHLVHGHKLGRTSPHRKALMKNLSIALIKHKMIRTTLPKARALREYLEPMITRAKQDSVHNRRLAFAKLRNPEAVGTLFDTVAPAAHARPGGYLRVLKCGFRKGDCAPMAYIQLVDFADAKAPSASEAS